MRRGMRKRTMKVINFALLIGREPCNFVTLYPLRVIREDSWQREYARDGSSSKQVGEKIELALWKVYLVEILMEFFFREQEMHDRLHFYGEI